MAKDIFAIIVGYLLSFVLGTLLVRWVIFVLDKKFRTRVWKVDMGLIIGLCETFLAITFILIKEFTALALIFAAKSIVRVKKMEEEPEYYLLGTVVNFSFSVLAGIIISILLKR
jgi:hypothetical protein